MLSSQRKRRSPIATVKYEHNWHETKFWSTKSRFVASELKLEWERLFQNILKWFWRKNDLVGLRTTRKRKQRKKLIWEADNYSIFTSSVSHAKRKYSLTLNNFSLSSQQLVPNCFLYPYKMSWRPSSWDFGPITILCEPPPFLRLHIWQNFPVGWYDKKGWKIVCNWLIMRSSLCPNLVKIGCNANFL